MFDSRLALDGGEPVRRSLLPYGRQCIDESDLAAVAAVLRSDWLTTGPTVEGFEQDFARSTGTRYAVAVSSGTAALHAAMYAIDIVPGDEVLIPAMTFAATANCVVYQGGSPVFVDVEPDTLLIDPVDVERRITAKTRAIIAVDYAGLPCDYDRLLEIARQHELALVADACHSPGGKYNGRPVGSLADLSAFSLHPVKHLTAGEGGVVTTNDAEIAGRVRRFRNHGISSDHRSREAAGSWVYEMVDLGYNYRITDLQCGLARSQLQKLASWVIRRREIANNYDQAFSESPYIQPLGTRRGRDHAYHLYVIRLRDLPEGIDRATIFRALRAEGIGVNVHYIPVHLHPFYQERFGTSRGLCPIAEAAYEEILSLPMFPSMTEEDVYDVVRAFFNVFNSLAPQVTT
jgi:perosamine synthetase